MKKWIAIAATLVFAAAGFAFAAQGPWGTGWGHGFRGPDRGMMGQWFLALLQNDQFRAQVNLTDSQVSRLRQIVANTEKANIQTRAQMRIDGIDLGQLLHSEKPDRAAVLKKVQQISELRGQMMKNNVQALLDAKTVLSPQQQEEVRQFIKKRFRERRRGQSWMEHRQGRMMMRHGTPPQPPTAPAPPQPPSQ